MVDGLWTIEFISSMGVGTGVMVLTENRLLGGDAGYYYSGEYTVADHHIRGKAEIVRFDRNSLSVFGDLPSFTLGFDGKISEDSIEGTAHLSGQPELKAQIRCRKKTGL